MLLRWIVVLVAVVSVPGPAAAALAPGSYVHTLAHGGVERSYRLHVPPGYDGSQDVPLVLNIHGFTSFAEQQEVISGILPIADREGFIVAHPEGIKNAWNAGVCCGNADLDDVGFLRTVVADIGGRARIDRRRVYVTGLSNGGAMSHRLACDAADLFAAAAPMAFPIPLAPLSACQPSRPIAVMTSMGLTDVLVRYDGGPFASAADTFARWSEINGCTGAQPDTTVVLGQSRCETYTRCSGGVETQLCSVYADSLVGTPYEGHVLYLNADIALTEAAWSFLSRFELPEAPAHVVLSGTGLLRSGRTKGRKPIAWTVSLDGDAWTAADGNGHVYTGTARRRGKSRTFALTPTDDARAILAAVLTGDLAALGATTGAGVTVDPRDTLRVVTDRDGVPKKLKGVLRLQRDGASAGRFTVKAKR